jgi:hypothetical protein
MPYSDTFPYNGANAIYAKPVAAGSTPSSTPSWGADVVAGGTAVNNAVPFTGLADGMPYWVYERIGGSPASTDILLGDISPPASSELSADSVAAVVSGLYDSLSGISPTVSLAYDPITMQIRLTDGDDWKDGVRTIDVPVVLPAGVDVADCTATFGAVRGSARIDKEIEVDLDVDDDPFVRIIFDRADTLSKPNGRYNYDVEIQYTDSTPVTHSLTVLEGVLVLRTGIARLPADIVSPPVLSGIGSMAIGSTFGIA